MVAVCQDKTSTITQFCLVYLGLKSEGETRYKHGLMMQKRKLENKTNVPKATPSGRPTKSPNLSMFHCHYILLVTYA